MFSNSQITEETNVFSSLNKYLVGSLLAIAEIFLIQAQFNISFRFACNLNNDAILSALGLGNAFIWMVPFSLNFGVNLAIRAYVKRAGQANDIKAAGMYLQKALLVNSAMFIVVVLLSFLCSPMLTSMGVSSEISDFTESYVVKSLPGLFLLTIADALFGFLASLDHTRAIAVIMTIVLPNHLIFCWIFVSENNFGLEGVAYAQNMTALLIAILTSFYCFSCSELNDAWQKPSFALFNDMKHFLKGCV